MDYSNYDIREDCPTGYRHSMCSHEEEGHDPIMDRLDRKYAPRIEMFRATTKPTEKDFAITILPVTD